MKQGLASILKFQTHTNAEFTQGSRCARANVSVHVGVVFLFSKIRSIHTDRPVLRPPADHRIHQTETVLLKFPTIKSSNLVFLKSKYSTHRSPLKCGFRIEMTPKDVYLPASCGRRPAAIAFFATPSGSASHVF